MNTAYARYTTFTVNANTDYRLKIVYGYSGTAGDGGLGQSNHSSMKFSITSPKIVTMIQGQAKQLVQHTTKVHGAY